MKKKIITICAVVLFLTAFGLSLYPLISNYVNQMRTYLDEDEQELRTLTDSAVYKLSRITDDAFEKLDLIPEF